MHKSGYLGFRQVSSNFHFIEEDLSLFTLTYLYEGKALNVFLVCESKFESSELDSQLRLGDKLMLIGKFIYLASVWF